MFLAEKIVPRKRVGLIVEVRSQISAIAVFNQGPAALDPRPVPAGRSQATAWQRLPPTATHF